MGGTACSRRRWRARRGLSLPGLLLAAGALLFACGQPGGAGPPTGAAVGIAERPAPPAEVTPVPTYPAPIAATPVPPYPNPEPTRTPGPLPTWPPTPRPEEPYHLTGVGTGIPDVRLSTMEATVVVIGTIRQVLPARWSTPGGQRPANPHDPANREAIYRPVLIEVEQYLKGGQPQRHLVLFAYGGTVGQDKMESTLSGRPRYMMQEGERVVVFLNERLQGSTRTLNGHPLWRLLSGHYTVSQEGLATDGFRTVPLQQLLDEIAAAQQQP